MSPLYRAVLAGAGAAPLDGPSGTTRYVSITVQSSQVATSTTLAMVYDLSLMPAGFWSAVQADGGDIRVTDNLEEGYTRYPVEVANIDTGAETGEVYFSAFVSSASNTEFFLWFDGGGGLSQPGVGALYGRNDVWDDESWSGVWHLDDTSDSTGNGYTWTQNLGAFVSSGGKVAGGGYYDTQGAGWLDQSVSGDTTFNVGSGSDQFVMIWFDPQENPNDGSAHLFCAGEPGSTTDQHWTLKANNVNTDLRYRLYSDGGTGLGRDGTNGWVTGADTWLHGGAKFDYNTEYALYENASEVNQQTPGTNTFTMSNAANQVLTTAGDHGSGSTDEWDVHIDEIRVHSGASAPSNNSILNWYRNTNDPSTWFSTGTVQS